MAAAKKFLVLGTGLGMGVASAMLLAPMVAPPKDHQHSRDEGGGGEGPSRERRESIFDVCATKYDDEIGMDEFFMGLPLLRRWVVSKAKGNVLEAACGTGRNLTYYNMDLCAVTLVDNSAEMVSTCKDKLADLDDARRKRMAVFQMDAEEMRFKDSSFDTVLQSFGLCSVEDPVKSLREMIS